MMFPFDFVKIFFFIFQEKKIKQKVVQSIAFFEQQMSVYLENHLRSWKFTAKRRETTQ